VKYQVLIAPVAQRMLGSIDDRRIRQLIAERIDILTSEPEKRGKPLSGELQGYRSLRAVGQRYRIIFRVERSRVLVYVIAVGLRREGSRNDVYELARKLVRLGLVELPPQ
jgi:mRNA interferase RelE/StbE